MGSQLFWKILQMVSYLATILFILMISEKSVWQKC